MPRPGPRTTYKYSDEFKATAVRLSRLPGVAVQDVADSLYIHPFMLSLWRKQAREGKIVVKAVAVKGSSRQDDGLQFDERDLKAELAAEKAAKDAKDILLQEAANRVVGVLDGAVAARLRWDVYAAVRIGVRAMI